ncbi:MAG TPA: chemotaxis protein CheX [Armatimonadota bacterium]
MTTLEAIPNIDPQVECVKEAVKATFAMVCGAEPTYTGEASDDGIGEQIIGVISLLGERSWSLMMCLPALTATAIAQKFCGFDIPYESADMGDFVGELINIFAGGVTARLEGIGIRAEMSLPTMVRGRDITLPLPEGLQKARLAFSSSDGDFTVRLVAGDPRAATLRRSGA